MTDLDFKALPEVEAGLEAAVPAAEAPPLLTSEAGQTVDGASPPADRVPLVPRPEGVGAKPTAFRHVPWQWSTEREDELRRLHGEGRRPTEIAQLMGITRNAACGKLSRLGLVTRRLPHWGPPKPRERSVARPRPPVVLRPRPARPKPIHAFVAGKATIWRLGKRHCRWPLWSDAERRIEKQFYCGGEVVRSAPYCGEHCKRAWNDHAR